MEDFLKSARKQLEDLDLQRQIRNLDLGKLRDADLSKLKDVPLTNKGKALRKQMELLEHQKREEQAASEGFVGGMLLGIVVGAILALIFAPKTGSETRGIVAGTATELIHKAEELVGQVRTEGSHASTLNSESTNG